MNKRILSILLCLLLVASLLVLAIPAGAAPAEGMQLKVVADKESAKAGDTVAYQIVMGPVSDIGSIQMTVDIPAGLTYKEGTAKVAEGLVAAMGFDSISFEETSMVLNGYSSAADYASTEETVLGSFECTVDEEATGTLSVGLTDVEMGSCQTFEVFSDLFVIEAADVTVESTVVDPTEESTEEPAPCEHELKHVDEVPATEEADGIKAHYVCEKCGKLFEDAFATVELTEADLVIPKIVPVDPTTAPEDPTAAPADPTTAPEDPTTAPEDPTTAPEDPTTAPVVDPTTAPVVDPTTAPAAPTEASTVAPTVAPTKAPVATKDTATKDTATKDTSTSSPKTGDSTNMYLWILIMLASMVGAGVVLFTAKRKGIFSK